MRSCWCWRIQVKKNKKIRRWNRFNGKHHVFRECEWMNKIFGLFNIWGISRGNIIKSTYCMKLNINNQNRCDYLKSVFSLVHFRVTTKHFNRNHANDFIANIVSCSYYCLFMIMHLYDIVFWWKLNNNINMLFMLCHIRSRNFKCNTIF